MSRSRIKTPIYGNTTVASEKIAKRLANRAYRRTTHVEVSQGKEVIAAVKEVSNVWDFPKDGKSYWQQALPKYWRK